MRILVTESVGIKGVSHRRGDRVEVDDKDGRLLIQMGRAKFLEDEQPVEVEFPTNGSALVAGAVSEDKPAQNPDKPHRKWRKGN